MLSPKQMPAIMTANESLWKVDTLMFDIGKKLSGDDL